MLITATACIQSRRKSLRLSMLMRAQLLILLPLLPTHTQAQKHKSPKWIFLLQQKQTGLSGVIVASVLVEFPTGLQRETD